MTEVREIPIEYCILHVLTEEEWPIDRPFRRSQMAELVSQRCDVKIGTKRVVGDAIQRLRDVGFVHRTSHVSGKQAYVPADQWSDPACAGFLPEFIKRPDDPLLEFDHETLSLLQRQISTETSSAIFSDAVHLAVRIMRLNRVYIGLSKYGWVPAARKLFDLKFETTTEQKERIVSLLEVIKTRDLDAMESFIPSTILQPI